MDQQRAAPRRPGGGNGGRLGLLLALMAVVGGMLAWPLLSPHLSRLSLWLTVTPPSSPSSTPSPSALPSPSGTVASMLAMPGLESKVDQIETALLPLSLRLDMAEQRLAKAEEALRRLASDRPLVGAGTGAEQTPSAMGEDMARLRDEFEALRRLTLDQGGAGRLSAAIERTETAVRRLSDRRDLGPLALVAVGHLREAVDRGGAYGAPLQAVTTLWGASAAAAPMLAVLTPHAATGVETRLSLGLRFADVSQAALRGAAADNASGSAPGGDGAFAPVLAPVLAPVFDRVRQSVGSAVSVRRSDGSHEGLAAALGRASRLMAAGDLAGAVAVLSPLQDPALSPWLETARTRLAADAALSSLSAQAILQTTPGQMPGQGD